MLYTRYICTYKITDRNQTFTAPPVGAVLSNTALCFKTDINFWADECRLHECELDGREEEEVCVKPAPPSGHVTNDVWEVAVQ